MPRNQIPRIRIGTRGSPLALYQAHETKSRLIAAHGFAEDEVAIITITTTGDQIRDRPLSDIGGKGLFTKEIEEALFAGEIDLAVHSLKDVPAHLPQGLKLAATLPREDARDAFISLKVKSIADLPEGACLGSSSARRTAQMLRQRPDLKTTGFRGNVETRLQKLAQGQADATFLACAGLKRLGLAQHITEAISVDVMVPAIAQGAIALEIRSNDSAIEQFLQPLNHAETAIAVSCERAFLKALNGSCRTPLAGHAIIVTEGENTQSLRFRGLALTPDGTHVFETTREGPLAEAENMGLDAGKEIKQRGGRFIEF